VFRGPEEKNCKGCEACPDNAGNAIRRTPSNKKTEGVGNKDHGRFVVSDINVQSFSSEPLLRGVHENISIKLQ
jgi:hypothetical protein